MNSSNHEGLMPLRENHHRVRRRGQPASSPHQSDGHHNNNSSKRKSAGGLMILLIGGSIIALLFCGFIPLVLHASFSLGVVQTSSSPPKIATKKKKEAVIVIPNNVVTNPPTNISLVECILIGDPGTTTTTSMMTTTDGGSGGGDMDRKQKLIQITVRHDLSPIASKVFIDLVQSHHFHQNFIFRVLPKFIAQWGVRTAGTEKDVLPHEKPVKTKDLVHEHSLSNVRGTLSFAGGNPATQQVFVNLGNNQRLDRENHGTDRPFATVGDESMKYVFDELYTGYKDGQGQIKALHGGLEEVHKQFPHWSRIETCRVVPHFSPFERTTT